MYACLAKVVREGGFKIALIIRLSAIPGHCKLSPSPHAMFALADKHVLPRTVTTAVFSTCGMSIFTFAIAAVLSLPKQFITVYLGVAMEQSENGGKCVVAHVWDAWLTLCMRVGGSRTDTIVKDIVIGITVLITIGAMWYVNTKLNQAKPAVIYEKRKARCVLLLNYASPLACLPLAPTVAKPSSWLRHTRRETGLPCPSRSTRTFPRQRSPSPHTPRPSTAPHTSSGTRTAVLWATLPTRAYSSPSRAARSPAPSQQHPRTVHNRAPTPPTR